MSDAIFNHPIILGFGMPGHSEWIILLVLGLLIFGKRLPEVGRSLGRSIVEFKRGIKGVQDEIDAESSRSSSSIDSGERSSELPGSEPNYRRAENSGGAVGAVHEERPATEG